MNASRVKNKPSYTSSINLGTSGIEYTPEENAAVRLAVLEALEKIILRKENEAIKCPVAGGFGNIVASAALVDPSSKVRFAAARMLAKYGAPAVLSFFLNRMHKSVLAGNTPVSQHGEEAIQNMVDVLEAGRIRGTVVSALLNCADTRDARLWMVAEKAVWDLFIGAEGQEKKDLQWHLEEMRIKLTMGSKKGTYGHPDLVMQRWLEVSRNMENLLGPAKTPPKNVEPGEKPTRPMRPDKDAFVRPPKKMRGGSPTPSEVDDEPHIRRGPAVELVMRIGRTISKPFRRAQGPRK